MDNVLRKLDEIYRDHDEHDKGGKLFVLYNLFVDVEYENLIFNEIQKRRRKSEFLFINYVGVEINRKKLNKKLRTKPNEDNIDLKIFAQHKALKEDKMSEYQKLENYKENELKKHLFDQGQNEAEDQTKRAKKNNGLLIGNDSDTDSSNIGDSVLEEYWEDFEIDK